MLKIFRFLFFFVEKILKERILNIMWTIMDLISLIMNAYIFNKLISSDMRRDLLNKKNIVLNFSFIFAYRVIFSLVSSD